MHKKVILVQDQAAAAAPNPLRLRLLQHQTRLRRSLSPNKTKAHRAARQSPPQEDGGPTETQDAEGAA